MEITEVRIFPRKEEFTGEKKLKAYAAIIFDNEFAVNGIQVIEGRYGLFVAMPGRQMPDGRFADTAHPTNCSLRSRIESKVLQEFLKLTEPAAKNNWNTDAWQGEAINGTC